MSERTMTLPDGTLVHEGDKVRAFGESGGLRVCTVLEIIRGCGVDKAILTAGTVIRNGKLGSTFGTVIRTRYQIKPWRARG